MTIKIISIGKTNVSWISEAIKHYENRLRHYIKVEWIELADAKKVDRQNEALLKKAEAGLILGQVNAGDRVYLLDEGGKQMSSEGFAKFIQKEALGSTRYLVFVIGGAYGFDREVVEKASGKISLSKMTFTHQMVRSVFIEQVYRAMTILKGEPYHHS